MISLNGSLRTCKVNVGYANRIQSDRFFNPNQQVCPVWNGVDTAGRPVCPNSFYTKTAGCNSAEDRVLVENYLRPNYSEYITLNTQGIEQETNMHTANVQCQQAGLVEGFSQGGHFGGIPTQGNFITGCQSCSHGNTAYEQGMQQEMVRQNAFDQVSTQRM